MARPARPLFPLLGFSLLLLGAPALAAASHTVSGVLRFRGPGKLYLALHDAASFAGGGPGRQVLVVEAPASDGIVEAPFTFTEVPAGEWALRCYQDRNGNGRLDMGVLGPREPWGVSGERRRRAPRFEEVRFTVSGEVAGLVVPVE